MTKTLYLECATGISGDMTVAALLDLGADLQHLRDALASLPLSGYEIKVSRVSKNGLDACDFDVVLDTDNHDHDMAYLYGDAPHTHDTHDHDHDHPHDHHDGHHHDHSHHHEEHHEHHEGADHVHGHDHTHRGLADITAIIRAGSLTPGARNLALRVFDILADAEAKAHGIPKDKVHFHEVGAVDSIVDVVSFAVCADDLGISEVIIPSIHEGSGTVRCQHGILPVPVPAVTNIAVAHGLSFNFGSEKGEMVTPTGAAMAAAIVTGTRLPSRFHIEAVGLGAGKREYDRPSILRAMVISAAGPEKDTIVKLESDIDDCSGEVLGYTAGLLFKAGAREVHYSPIYMKKNRPAWELVVICNEDHIPKMESIIFSETSTIGIRRIAMERTVLPREMKTIATPLGDAAIKICTTDQGEKIYPEYDAVIELCAKTGRTFNEVYDYIRRAAFDLKD